MGIANSAPLSDMPLDHIPKLTLRMVARIQSFPDSWEFAGGKTASYRQIGNAFPPLVAKALGTSILALLTGKPSRSKQGKREQMRLLEKPAEYKTTKRKARK